MRIAIAIGLLAVLCAVWPTASAASVFVSVGEPRITDTPKGEQFVQSVTLANEIVQYRLTYDITRDPDDANRVTSHYWGWTQEWISLGMTEPSQPNWYWQAFFNWYFDEESLHVRPAELRLVRKSGQDGMVEYVWDTPTVRASVRFALTTDSDKLLMFGSYEAKQEVERSYVKFTCYPATFDEPRNRAVTTAKGTFRPGNEVRLDAEAERWVLYEDTTEGRPAAGSAGMIIGTPGAFSEITIPVGSYGITTRMELGERQRSFAVGLYDFPTLPDYERTRRYFRESGEAQARQLEEMAAGDLDEPLPPIPVAEDRLALLMEKGRRALDRPAEVWRPAPERLAFPWADRLAGGPVKAVIFCRRWTAWSTMELARRLEMDAEHLYFDTRTRLTSPGSWPYRRQTGIGPIQYGVAARKAARLSKQDEVELFLCAGLVGEAVPPVSRRSITDQVAAGKGLLIVGGADTLKGWPEELFENEAPDVAEQILENYDWESVPGYREGDPGRITEGPPVRAYRYGEGRVVHLKIRRPKYSALVPKNSASEGLRGATDRCLAVAARAALGAARREATCDISVETDPTQPGTAHINVHPAAPDGSELILRVQDDLDRVIQLGAEALPIGDEGIVLPAIPAGRQCFLDAMVRDGEGRCLGFASAVLPPATGPTITDVSISPSTLIHEAAVPRVELPAGGEVRCSAVVEGAADLDDAELRFEIQDCAGRVVARESREVPAAGGAVSVSLSLPRPVVVAHTLDISLQAGGATVAFARQRFAVQRPYPYDDFTVLLWTYAGGDPVLQQTNRKCYELGADMCDLCHMGGYGDTGAAREYSLTARSGLRLVPYVTRLAGTANKEHHRVPCLHDPEYLASRRESLTETCRQAAPYCPAGYTLGDENYLFRGSGECCHSPESVEAFQGWLRDRYGDPDALNYAWDAEYESFDEISTPMLLDEAAKQEVSFAPWIDHKRFMDSAFADTHREFRDVIRKQDAGAKVGWDGLLGYSWKSGYDFEKMTAGLELNETYTMHWLQGELVRSFKEPDALTGKWGNAVADNEAGWSAFPWDCLLKGDNSVWWWTSWGVDYIPFNPDLSVNDFGRWFFDSAREVKAGPGKLLLHAEREHSGIAVLYSQRDLFAATVMGELVDDGAFAGGGTFLQEHRALLRAINDLGYQATHISFSDLEEGRISADEYKVLFLPLASCLSDEQVEALHEYVATGGTVVVDGRAGLLTEDGRIRETRPLDALLGVDAPAGHDAAAMDGVSGEAAVEGELAGAVSSERVAIDAVSLSVMEPAMSVTNGRALGEVNGAPVLVWNLSGKGAAITLNFGVQSALERRAEDGPKPILEILDAVLRSAGVRRPCELARHDNTRPLCTARIMYSDGPLRYLALQQDILQKGLSKQEAHVTLDAPAIVYDVREGERIGAGRVAEWDVELSRGRPLVYALLPYEVTGVSAEAPDSAKQGETIAVAAQVGVSEGEPGYHVVRLDVFAPGSDTPHRQYSQNIGCENGAGSVDVPFALNDRTGAWRLTLRDTASGMTAEREVILR